MVTVLLEVNTQRLLNIVFQYPKELTKFFSFGEGNCHVLLVLWGVPPYLHNHDHMLLQFQVTAIKVQEEWELPNR